MKHKKMFSIIAAVILVAGLVYASSLRFQDNFVNVEESDASGSVSIKVAELTRDSLDRVSLKILVEKLIVGEDEVFEAWLVDEDTGYKLSLGAFLTNSRGKGILKFNQKMVNFDIYDKVVVTREPSIDVNPMPGDAVLLAEIDSDDEIVNLIADISGANEVPPTESITTGSGWFVLNQDANTLSFNITYEGLDSEETGAHIHGPAPVGVDAAVLFTLPSENPKIGVWNYDEGQETDILSGLTYVNIHSSEFPGGEIRGQIVAND